MISFRGMVMKSNEKQNLPEDMALIPEGLFGWIMLKEGLLHD